MLNKKILYLILTGDSFRVSDNLISKCNLYVCIDTFILKLDYICIHVQYLLQRVNFFSVYIYKITQVFNLVHILRYTFK